MTVTNKPEASSKVSTSVVGAGVGASSALRLPPDETVSDVRMTVSARAVLFISAE